MTRSMIFCAVLPIFFRLIRSVSELTLRTFLHLQECLLASTWVGSESHVMCIPFNINITHSCIGSACSVLVIIIYNKVYKWHKYIKLFNINTLKNTIVDFWKTRTCFCKKSYMFFGKHVRLFTASFDKEQERTWKYTISPLLTRAKKHFFLSSIS